MPETAPPRIDQLLKSVPLFSELGTEALTVVARHCSLLSFAAGERVFEQASDATELFIVESGVVSVRRRADDGAEQELAQFVAGELFGEVDLVGTIPRSASAIAMEPTSLLVFPGPGRSFRELAEGNPALFAPLLQGLLASVAHRIRAANRLVSEKAPWVRELQRQLYRDKLTGLLNRAWIDERLDEALRECRSASLLVEKPDGLKALNDRWGHTAGDVVIRLMADSARSVLGDEGTVCRYCGDEFAILLPDLGEDEALERAELLHEGVRAIDTSPGTGGVPAALTASIGIAIWAGTQEKAQELVGRAFKAMLAARGEGGDRTRCS